MGNNNAVNNLDSYGITAANYTATTPDKEGTSTPDKEGTSTPDKEGTSTPDKEGTSIIDLDKEGTYTTNKENIFIIPDTPYDPYDIDYMGSTECIFLGILVGIIITLIIFDVTKDM